MSSLSPSWRCLTTCHCLKTLPPTQPGPGLSLNRHPAALRPGLRPRRCRQAAEVEAWSVDLAHGWSLSLTVFLCCFLVTNISLKLEVSHLKKNPELCLLWKDLEILHVTVTSMGHAPPSHGWPAPRPGLRPIRAPLTLTCSSRPGPPGSLGFPASLCQGPGPRARLQGDGAKNRRHGVRSLESEPPPTPSTAETWPSFGIIFFSFLLYSFLL